MSKINAINNKSGSVTIDPGASGDSYVQFSINGTGKFRIGVDDDAADAFKVSQGSALGSNDALIVTANGEITRPLQPAFLVADSTVTNVTGDGTDYTVVWSTGTEFFDQNNDFDGTSTFTAPVTGKYMFTADLYLAEISAAHTTGYITLSTSNRDYVVGYINPGASRTSGNAISLGFSILADMDSADTAVVKVMVSGGTKVVDFNGYNRNDFFSGYLAC